MWRHNTRTQSLAFLWLAQVFGVSPFYHFSSLFFQYHTESVLYATLQLHCHIVYVCDKKRGKEKRRRQLWAAETFMRHFQRQMALLSACKSFFFLLSFVAFVAVPLCSAIKYSVVQQAVALYLYATIVWQATDDFFLCILMCTQTCLSAMPRDRWS